MIRQVEETNAGITHFTVLHFSVLCIHGVYYKLKGKPSISKKITAGFIVRLALFGWCGTEPAVSVRCDCSIYAGDWTGLHGEEDSGCSVELENHSMLPSNTKMSLTFQ